MFFDINIEEDLYVSLKNCKNIFTVPVHYLDFGECFLIWSGAGTL
jgi:hypothetical protein